MKSYKLLSVALATFLVLAVGGAFAYRYILNHQPSERGIPQTESLSDTKTHSGLSVAEQDKKQVVEAEGEIVEDLPPAQVDSVVPSQAGPKPSLKKPGLRVTSINAREGQNYFSIEVNCREGKSWDCHMQNGSPEGYVRVEPAVNFRVVPANDSFTLIGPFEASTEYKITIFSGLESKNMYLTETIERIVHTPAFNPSVRFQLNARYLPRHAGMELAFESRNVDEFQLEVRRIHPQNTVFWLTGNGQSDLERTSDVVLKKTVKVDNETNKRFKGKLDLSELKTLGKGIFAIKAAKDESYWSKYDQSVVVITNIAAIAKKGRDSIHVWTRSLVDLAPHRDVTVKAFSYTNELLGTCATGTTGSECSITGIPADKTPYALSLESGEDMSYIRFSDLEITDDSVHAGDRAYFEAKKPMDAFIYTSRGVYRPGEIIQMAAMVRNKDYTPIGEVPLTLTVRDPRDKNIKEVVLTTSKMGVLGFDLPLTFQSETGKYTIELKSGEPIAQQHVLVEEFVPERIGSKVTAAQETYVGKELPQFNVDAKFLFGPPVAEGEYDFRCSITQAWNTIPGRSEFSVGLLPQPGRLKSYTFPDLTGSLDKDGLSSAKCDYSSLLESFPTVMRVTGTFDIKESGSGRVTSKSASALASPVKEIIGLRATETSSSSLAVEGQMFTPVGEETKSSGKIEVVINRVENNWIYVYDPDYGYYRWTSTGIYIPEGKKIVDLKDGSFKADFTPSRSWGSYVISATDPSTRFTTELETYVGYSWYWSGPNSDELATPAKPERLNMRVSEKMVKAGDTVKVQLEAPFAGQLFLSTETDQLHSSKYMDIKKGSTEIEVEIPDVRPNVYVSALLIKPPQDGTVYVPARASASISLLIDRSDVSQDIKIDAPESIRPNQNLDVSLTTAPHSDLTVAIVDEGVLQLTDFKTPNPLDHFFAARRLGVETFETFGWTQPTLMNKGSTGGGGPGGAGRQPAIPTKIVSYWSGIIQANQDGKAQVSMPVPPFQGKLRIMAVSSHTGATGTADAYVTVRDPLVVQPSFPRFLSKGDQFELPVFIVNLTGKRQNVAVQAETSGAAVPIKDPKQSISLADKESKTVTFHGQVNDLAGAVKFRVEANGEEIQSFDEQEIPLVPATPKATLTRVVSGKENINANQLLRGELLKDGLNIEAGISHVKYIEQLSGIANLVRYPYGCVEQTTSTTFPLLVMNDLLPLVAPKDVKQDEIPKMVQAGISRVLSMQTVAGGFSYWPGGGEPSEWSSVYVTHMLLTAREFGYKVPDSAIKSALGYLKKVAQADTGSDRRHRVHSQPYALYVLSLAGEHQKNTLKRLVTGKQNWGTSYQEANFLIMAALHSAGERQLAEQFATKADLYNTATFEDRDYARSFYSSLRVDAMRLAVAEKLWPGGSQQDGLAQKVAQRLVQTTYWTTQEMAWGLIGLARRVQAFNKAKVTDISLSIAGKSVEPSQSKMEMPVWQFTGLEQLTEPMSFNYKKVGENDPEAYIRFTGYLANLPQQSSASAKLMVGRSFMNGDGERVNPDDVKQGDTIIVELVAENRTDSTMENLALVDRLPAGFEVENPRLGRSRKINWVDEGEQFKPDYVDIRDGAVRAFGTLAPRTSKRYYYVVRAVTAGQFTAPPAKIEPMYEPELVFYTQPTQVIVKGVGQK